MYDAHMDQLSVLADFIAQHNMNHIFKHIWCKYVDILAISSN